MRKKKKKQENNRTNLNKNKTHDEHIERTNKQGSQLMKLEYVIGMVSRIMQHNQKLKK